jgi:hypothetical protein
VRPPFSHEPTLDEVADEVADGAPVEPGPLRELGPRGWATQMDASQDGAKVAPPDSVARRSAHGSGRSMACHFGDRGVLLGSGYVGRANK